MRETDEKEEIRCQLEVADIDKLNRIFEGCDGIGIVSTIDRKRGLVVVRVTPETYDEALTILLNAPFAVNILS